MKNLTCFILLCCCSLYIYGQAEYNGFPVIKANSIMVDIQLNDVRRNGAWIISPHIENDSLSLMCFNGNESFVFYTDIDSIAFELKPGESHKFYVSLSDTAYAFTIIQGLKPEAIEFDKFSRNSNIEFTYENIGTNEYLNTLRSKYHLDAVINGAETDTERALRILHWVHNQWNHNGDNQPQKNDALSILEEVKEGKNFRCVEYGIVTAACLNSFGMKARVLALKTGDVETAAYGAGHVGAEVFLTDINKWVFLDGQWDAMPVLNGTPLNAMEFQEAIINDYDEVEISSMSDVSKSVYVNWIFPYLFYFDTPFDNREGTGLTRILIDGKRKLMLVPVGAKNPEVFQVKSKIDYCLYTHSVKDFYAKP